MMRLSLVALALVASTSPAFAQGVPPDTILYNGKIVTVDKSSFPRRSREA